MRHADSFFTPILNDSWRPETKLLA